LRRAGLRLFVRLDLLLPDQVSGMLAWALSGCHVYMTVWVPDSDCAFAMRRARYGAWNPVALEHLDHDRTATAVTDRSDSPDGSAAGAETADPLEFLAHVLVHIPDQGHLTTRYDGW